ncbi:MAG: SusC/RagA family TonB-linked outer membrane protein, partial [Sphingobacteriales bacterium]
DKTVSGKVSDSKDGSPVAGASVVAKGAKVGTQTKADGTFSLRVPASVTKLVISSLNFDEQEVSVGSGDVSVSLVASSSSLSDVVVIGYGTTRKKDLTGAVTSVKAKDFNQGVIASPDQLIQGKVAGLQVVTSSGAPGAAATIRIRGNGSIRAGNNPLFVVDGIPLDGRLARPGFAPPTLGTTPESNPLYFFNAADIASMDVLKDASATAIYGSRGANGVIVITTKQGTSGAAKVDVSSSVGVSNMARRYKVLNGDEYRSALATYGLPTTVSTNAVPTGNFGASVNAFDEILQTGITNNHNVGISGGNENGKFRVSLGYFGQTGIVKNTGLNRYTVNANGQYKFLQNKRLSLDFNIFAGHATENIAPISTDAGFTGNLIGMALQWNPTQSLYNPAHPSGLNIIPGSTIVNPVAMQRGYTDISDIGNLMGIVGVGYKLTDDLEYKFTASVNRQSGIRRSMIARNVTLNLIENLGLGAYATTEFNSTVLQHTLNYNKRINKDLNLTALLGYEYQNVAFRGSNMSARGFVNDFVPFYNIMQNATAASRVVGSFEDPTAEIQSYFGRVILNYKDRYIFTGTMRADGSSRFGANNKYGYFPSAALAWNVLNEGFMKNNKVFQNLKVRASYGLTGNQAFPGGASQELWAYQANGAYAQQNAPNPDLKWETTKQLNIGVDFAVAKGRLYGSVDYFQRNSSDILFAFQVIQPAPLVAIWQNIPGAMIKNSGVELSIGGTLIQKKELTWNLSINSAFLKNSLDNYVGPPINTASVRGQGLSGAIAQRMASGHPLNVFYLREFTGLDANGLATYRNNEAPAYVGDPNPRMLLGISTDVQYKKWSLTINANGAYGHSIYNNTLNAVLPIGNLGTRNIASSLMDLSPREALSNPIKASSRYLESGDFLRLANLSIGYNVGAIGKNIKNMSVFFTGQNLFVITKYSGFDPEVNTDASNGGVPSFGMEYIPYPMARNLQLGVRFGL